MAFCRKRCFLNIFLRSVCVGTVTFSFSVGFDADWVLPCKVMDSYPEYTRQLDDVVIDDARN